MMETLRAFDEYVRHFLSVRDKLWHVSPPVVRVTAFGITAFVLAGGKSIRMGRDKAFLQLGDRTLLLRALDLASTVAAEVRIVGDATKLAAFGPVVEDVYRERGPLAAIHAALLSTTTELNLMLAVDLPFL